MDSSRKIKHENGYVPVFIKIFVMYFIVLDVWKSVDFNFILICFNLNIEHSGQTVGAGCTS